MARYSLVSAAKGRFLSLHETTAASPPNPPLAVRTSSAVRGVVGRSLGSSRESAVPDVPTDCRGRDPSVPATVNKRPAWRYCEWWWW